MSRFSHVLLVSVVVGMLSCEADQSPPDDDDSIGADSASGAPAGGDAPSANEARGGGNAGDAHGDAGLDQGGLGGGAGAFLTAGGAACDSIIPECCSAPDHLPCRGLSRPDCTELEYCKPVLGVPYDPAMSGEGGGPEPTYLGCYSFCGGVSQIEACTYDEDAPTACYHVPDQAVPDGWTRVSCSSDKLAQCEP